MKISAELPWAAARDRGAFSLILVRHGQTQWNLERRFLGVTDIALDDVGHAQAKSLSQRLKVEVAAVYSSPLKRAYQTALALHPSPVLMPGLQELHQGDLEGMKVVEAMERYPDFFQGWAVDPGSVTPPGGENLGDCQQRGLGSLDEIRAGHCDGEVAMLVSHQMVIATALCAIAGSPLSSWRDFRLPNTGLAVLTYDRQGWAIEALRWVVE
ncbi:MAG: hypothetical protein GWP91_15455 [Rhodobacterales bacterium]|nr:hypothetical protein [Rhodobacterales bacterium]